MESLHFGSYPRWKWWERDQGEERVMADSINMLLSSSPLFEYSSKEFPCNIVTSRQSYGQERVAFAFNNKSVYIELFNYHIKRVLDSVWQIDRNGSKTVSLLRKTACPLWNRRRQYIPTHDISWHIFCLCNRWNRLFSSLDKRLYRIRIKTPNSLIHNQENGS